MIERTTDPIMALMPIQSAPAPPSVAFAPFLDRAWGYRAEVAAAAASSPYETVAPANPRSKPSPTETHNPAPRPDSRSNDRKDDSRQPSTSEGPAAAETPIADSTPAPDNATTGAPSGGQTRHADDDQQEQDSQEPPDDHIGAVEGAAVGHANDHAEQPSDGGEQAVVPDGSKHTIAEKQTPGADQPNRASQEEAPATDKASHSNNMDPPLATSSAESEDAGIDKRSGKSSSGQADSDAAATEPKAAAGDEGSPTDESLPLSDQSAESTRPPVRRGKAPTAREAAQNRDSSSPPSNRAPRGENTSHATAATPETTAEPVGAGTVATALHEMGPVIGDAAAPAAQAAPAASAEGVVVEGTQTGSTTAAGSPGSAATDAQGMEPGEAVDRVRLVQRVARAFQAMGDRDGTVRLRLSPPELGAIRLEVTVRNGVMNARLEAETQAARQVLLENLPMLRERLDEQGIKVEQFQVDLSDEQPGGLPDRSDGQPQPDQPADAPRRHQAGGPHANENGTEHPRHLRRPGAMSELDVLI